MRADLFGQTELLEDLLEASANTNLDTIAEWGIDVSEVTPGAHHHLDRRAFDCHVGRQHRGCGRNDEHRTAGLVGYSV